MIASVNIYWYEDDDDSIYISSLRVDPKYRGMGIASELIKACEDATDRTNSYLWVEEGSWMQEWYKRIGYQYYQQHERPGFVWMRKVLTNHLHLI